MTIKWEYDIEGTVEEIKELLGMMQPKAVVQEEPPKAEVKAKPKPKKKKEVDSGKIKALRKAGWSMTKIADEMRCSISTVSRYCQENAA
jgi:DNA invertase Pin-like site-specific DNA recombinase